MEGEKCAQSVEGCEVESLEGRGRSMKAGQGDSAILRAYEISKEQICLKIAMA